MLIHQQFKDATTAHKAAEIMHLRFPTTKPHTSFIEGGMTIVVDVGALKLLPTSALTIQIQSWLEGVDVGSARITQG